MTDRIERTVSIAASVERVWTLITTAEHLGVWFGDAGAELDLEPNGRLTLHWEEHPTVEGHVVAIDPPHRFAFRWLHGEEDSTLVEFTVTPEGDGCRVTVVESGFAGLARGDRHVLLADHEGGWPVELGHLVAHAEAA